MEEGDICPAFEKGTGGGRPPVLLANITVANNGKAVGIFGAPQAGELFHATEAHSGFSNLIQEKALIIY